MGGLRWLVASEGLAAVFHMLAMGTPLVLFLDELGFNKSQIGLSFSLFHLAGPLALIIAPAVERFGLKRTYITFLSTRKVVLCCMILLPWIIANLGFDFALLYTVLVMGLYGLLRIVGETALFPWMLEAIPNSVRGKYTAVATMTATAIRLLAVMASGYVIGQYSGLWRYQTLIAIGCFIGLIAVLVRLKVPGGEPVKERRSRGLHFQQMKQALEPGLSDRPGYSTSMWCRKPRRWSTWLCFTRSSRWSASQVHSRVGSAVRLPARQGCEHAWVLRSRRTV